jgi:hypothetical protein
MSIFSTVPIRQNGADPSEEENHASFKFGHLYRISSGMTATRYLTSLGSDEWTARTLSTRTRRKQPKWVPVIRLCTNKARGVYLVKYAPPTAGGRGSRISADVTWGGGDMNKRKRNRGVGERKRKKGICIRGNLNWNDKHKINATMVHEE